MRNATELHGSMYETAAVPDSPGSCIMCLQLACMQAPTCHNVAQSDWKEVLPEEVGHRDISTHHHPHGNQHHVGDAVLQVTPASLACLHGAQTLPTTWMGLMSTSLAIY